MKAQIKYGQTEVFLTINDQKFEFTNNEFEELVKGNAVEISDSKKEKIYKHELSYQQFSKPIDESINLALEHVPEGWVCKNAKLITERERYFIMLNLIR